jgi:hypothetical protein
VRLLGLLRVRWVCDPPPLLIGHVVRHQKLEQRRSRQQSLFAKGFEGLLGLLHHVVIVAEVQVVDVVCLQRHPARERGGGGVEEG